ncbi:MAG TPA: MipA/OmpV family protein [Leucothrix mucor]|nr:MipA/OmpV family protein [Leucothrix mucor]
MKFSHHASPALFISMVALFALLPLTATAEWGAGVSMETTQSLYKNNSKGTEISVKATPRIEYRGDRLNIHDGTLSYSVIKADKYAIDVLTTSKNDGYQAKDKDIFKSMKERKASLDVGVRLRANTSYMPVSLTVTKDIYKSKGTELGLSLGGIKAEDKIWTGKRSVSVAPVLGADWQSKKSVDYYYGVRKSEATATRKAYQGKSAITPFIGLEAEAKLSEHFSLTGSAKYKHLPNAITDSSITKNKKSDYQVNLGLTYWF